MQAELYLHKEDKNKQHQNTVNYWIGEIDYLRGLAILGVILIHTSSYFVYVKEVNILVALNILIDVMAHFAVPLFICISAVLLSVKYGNGFAFRTFYKKRYGSVLPQYLFFSLLYLLFYYLLDGWRPGMMQAVQMVLTADTAYHLWFIAPLIQLYLLYPIIAVIYDYFCSKGRVRVFIFLCMVVQVAWNIPKGGETSKIFLGVILYFIVGMYVGNNLGLVKKYLNITSLKNIIPAIIILLLIKSSFWAAGIYKYGDFVDVPSYYFILPTIIDPVLYVLEFVVVYKAAAYLLNIKSFISWMIYQCGKFSFGIYLIHLMPVIGLQRILDNTGIHASNWGFYPAVFFLTIIISYIAVYLVSLIPFSNFLIGSRSKWGKGLNYCL